MSSQFQLMRERRFRPFFFTQFLGAFNDNVFKTALITLVTFQAGQLTELDGKTLATLLPGLFILPFFLFSATSGQIADKFDKAVVARAVKVFEIAVMALAAWGFMSRSLWPLVAALFLMGVHSTLFGPVKYAYLPQHLRQDELVGGNGMVEMGTFVAILVGQILGAWLATSSFGPTVTSAVVMSVAVLGYWVSRGIPVSPAADPELKINWNPLTETWRNLRFAKSNRTVWLSILGISWFWFYGATVLAQFPSYTKEVLHGDESVFILLLTVFSFGVGAGSLLCEKLSGHKVEIGLVPFGAIGLTVFGVDLYFYTPVTSTPGAVQDFTVFLGHLANWLGLADIALLGLFGGFYIVPLYALIQTRSEKSHQSRVIAANNILNALFMVVSAGVSMLLFALGLSIPELFLATAVFNAVIAIYIYALVPEFLVRFIVWLLIHTIYRLEPRGIDEHVPGEGGALIVCHHVRPIDLLAIMAACRRPIRFVVDRKVFKTPLLNFILRESRAIPVASAEEDPAMVLTALEEVAAALSAGELVAVFPDGGAAGDGEFHPFRPAVGAILERAPVPVVALSLSGLSERFFARDDDVVTKQPRRSVFSRIGLAAAPPLLPEHAAPDSLHALIAGLQADWK